MAAIGTLIATFQLLSTTSLNFRQSQNAVLGSALTLSQTSPGFYMSTEQVF